MEENIAEDTLDKAGKLFKPSAQQTESFLNEKKFRFRFCKNGHSRTPTGKKVHISPFLIGREQQINLFCIVVGFHPDRKTVYSAGKDGTVLRYGVIAKPKKR